MCLISRPCCHTFRGGRAAVARFEKAPFEISRKAEFSVESSGRAVLPCGSIDARFRNYVRSGGNPRHWSRVHERRRSVGARRKSVFPIRPERACGRVPSLPDAERRYDSTLSCGWLAGLSAIPHSILLSAPDTRSLSISSPVGQNVPQQIEPRVLRNLSSAASRHQPCADGSVTAQIAPQESQCRRGDRLIPLVAPDGSHARHFEALHAAAGTSMDEARSTRACQARLCVRHRGIRRALFSHHGLSHLPGLRFPHNRPTAGSGSCELNLANS